MKRTLNDRIRHNFAVFACFVLLFAGVDRCGQAGDGSDSAARTPGSDDVTRLEFFEERIRPVLVDHCYKCHSSDDSEPAGGLLLDTREGIRRGGHTGPAVVPGDLKESLLLNAIQYGNLEMPPDEKLSDEVIEDFRTWISLGAHDSRAEDSEQPVPVPEASDADQPACNCSGLLLSEGPAWLISASITSSWPNGFAAAMLAGR